MLSCLSSIIAIFSFIAVSNAKSTIVSSTTRDLSQKGLRVYNTQKSYNGYTLFAHIGFEIPLKVEQNPIYLINMEGEIVYQWLAENWAYHAQLKLNGNLIYNTATYVQDLFEKKELYDPNRLGHGLREINTRGNEIWYYPAFVEHDFQLLDNGNIIMDQDEMILEYQESLSNGSSVFSRTSPTIEIINPKNDVVWSWRGEKHIKDIESLLGIDIIAKEDWAHNNTSRILISNPSGLKDSRFKEGNVIISYSEFDAIGIIDYSTGKIVWAWGPGVIEGQHTPTMLENGNILIFDNGSSRRWSRVLELNPITEEIVWEYRGNPKESFFSEVFPGAQRLPNGNTLITDGIKNRIFEITSDGEVVWDFISTFNRKAGGGGIFRAYRYSSEYVKPLLNQGQNMSGQ